MGILLFIIKKNTMKQTKPKKQGKKISEMPEKEIQKQLTEKLVKSGISKDFLEKHFFVMKLG
jgi:hypothetical protein